jgi:hypothetical protein
MMKRKDSYDWRGEQARLEAMSSRLRSEFRRDDVLCREDRAAVGGAK